STGNLRTAAECEELAELYLEALKQVHANLGYEQLTEGNLPSTNVLRGIKQLTKPGQMLVGLTWQGEEIGHAIAVTKSKDGSIIIYDPNFGALRLPPSVTGKTLTLVVNKIININQGLSPDSKIS